MIRRLKAADPTLAERYNTRILDMQEIVDACVREFEAVVERREREREEAARLEEANKRLLAEQEQRQRQKEQEELLAAQEVARREKEELVKRVKSLAAEDPGILAEVVGLGKPYPAVPGSTCDTCASKGVPCRGVAGKSCEGCSKLHISCSNSSGQFLVHLTPEYYVYSLSISVRHATSKSSVSEPSSLYLCSSSLSARKAKTATAPAVEETKTRTRRTKASGTASSSKCKAIVIDDHDSSDNDGSTAGGPFRKKAKTPDTDSLLSRSEAADLIGKVVMEMETVQSSLDAAKELLAAFAGKANGKKRVVIKAPID